MSWDGHDFLDASRNEGIWEKAKEKLRTIGNDVPIEVIKVVLIDIMKKQLVGS